MIDPMDDEDLLWNMKRFRSNYWTRYGLFVPSNLRVRFADPKPGEFDVEGFCDFDCYPIEIRILPILRHAYSSAKIVLLHEMAHAHLGRKAAHGPRFKAEIDRLYSLGAYRELL